MSLILFSIYLDFDECVESIAVGAAIKMFRQRLVDVIVGPPCAAREYFWLKFKFNGSG